MLTWSASAKSRMSEFCPEVADDVQTTCAMAATRIAVAAAGTAIPDREKALPAYSAGVAMPMTVAVPMTDAPLRNWYVTPSDWIEVPAPEPAEMMQAVHIFTETRRLRPAGIVTS